MLNYLHNLLLLLAMRIGSYISFINMKVNSRNVSIVQIKIHAPNSPKAESYHCLVVSLDKVS